MNSPTSSDLVHSSRPALIVAVLASVYAWAMFASTFTHPGSIGLNYIAPGTDWSVMYEAARAAADGRLPFLYDGAAFTAHLNATHADWFNAQLEYRPWVYPPTFLLLLTPVSNLSFVSSYIVFQLATFAVLAGALLYRAPDTRTGLWLVLGALCSPAAANNVVNGQTAFLVAGLLVLGWRLAPRQPLLAGIAFGVLTFKPQYGLLIPVALVAAGHWRAIVASIAASVSLGVASGIIYGRDLWMSWGRQLADSFTQPDSPWIRFGRLWGNSVFACAATAGVPISVASHLQNLVTFACAIAVWLAIRSALSENRKVAFLLTAAFLAAPHSSPYDEILLVIAALLWLTTLPGTTLPRRLLLLGLWLAPLIGPPAIIAVGRLLPLIVLLFLAALWRKRNDVAEATICS